MREKWRNPLAFGLLAAVLSGCAGDKGDYPSLALRAFERGEAVPVPASPPPPIRPPSSSGQLADLIADASAAEKAFLAAEGDAARLARAASGQSAESNARTAALVALADLDVQRARTALALAGIDSLAAEAATALAPDPAVMSAQSRIADVLAGQDATITRLWGVMGS